MQDLEPRLAIEPRVRRSPYFEATRRWGSRPFPIYNHMYPTYPTSDYGA